MIWWILAIAAALSLTVYEELKIRREKRKAEYNHILLDAHRRHPIFALSGVERIARDNAQERVADRKLEPWWEEREREAFGYNDTERFLRETHSILNPPKPMEIAVGSITADTMTISHQATAQAEAYRTIRINDPVTAEHLGDVNVCVRCGEASCARAGGPGPACRGTQLVDSRVGSEISLHQEIPTERWIRHSDPVTGEFVGEPVRVCGRCHKAPCGRIGGPWPECNYPLLPF